MILRVGSGVHPEANDTTTFEFAPFGQIRQGKQNKASGEPAKLNLRREEIRIQSARKWAPVSFVKAKCGPLEDFNADIQDTGASDVRCFILAFRIWGRWGVGR